MKQREIYVPKAALLTWMQDTTNIPIKDVRDLSTGVHLCHLLHHLTDGKFKVKKVIENAKTEVERFKNLKLFNEGLENLHYAEKFDIDLILKKNYPATFEAAQRIHKMFKTAGKLVEKKIDKLQLLENARKNIEATKLSNEERAQEKGEHKPMEPEEFAKEMRRLQSRNTPERIDIEEEEVKEEVVEAPKVEEPPKWEKQEGQKIEKSEENLTNNQENERPLYPEVQESLPSNPYPTLPSFHVKSSPQPSPIQGLNPFINLLKKEEVFHSVEKEEKPKEIKERNTPEFSEIKKVNNSPEDDEQLLSTTKPYPWKSPQVPSNKKEELMKKSREIHVQTDEKPFGKSLSRTNQKSNPKSASVSAKRPVSPSPRPNPDPKHSPSALSSVTTNLLDLDSKKKRMM